jgi:2-phosphosulfolactate phosphatase
MIELYNIPAGIPERLDQDRPVVIIDIFRASTSMTAALAAGAKVIHVAGSMKHASELNAKFGPDVLMAGERGGLKIDGYDLGNSPYEMSVDKVSDKSLIFNSTNGTKLLSHFMDFEHVAVGSFVSLTATIEFIKSHDKHPVICCAGTEGRFSAEDTLAAGQIISRLNHPESDLDDAATSACRLVELASDRWHEWARHSFHGRTLTSLGMSKDLDFCLTVDKYDFVPVKSGSVIVGRA